MANNKSKINPAKRNAQNQRTMRNVTKRRAKHEKLHGPIIGAHRWTQAPVAKTVQAKAEKAK